MASRYYLVYNGQTSKIILIQGVKISFGIQITANLIPRNFILAVSFRHGQGKTFIVQTLFYSGYSKPSHQAIIFVSFSFRDLCVIIK